MTAIQKELGAGPRIDLSDPRADDRKLFSEDPSAGEEKASSLLVFPLRKLLPEKLYLLLHRPDNPYHSLLPFAFPLSAVSISTLSTASSPLVFSAFSMEAI